MTRTYETYLKVSGWNSEYPSVQLLLNHLKRRTQSEKSKVNYLQTLYWLCREQNNSTPDRLVKLPRAKVEQIIQSFCDKRNDGGTSKKYLNVMLEYLKTFYAQNGYRNGKSLTLERFHVPIRTRVLEEHIPRKEEIEAMAQCAPSRKWKATILALYSSGFRNSTLRAVLYRDVREELEDPRVDIVKVPCYIEWHASEACLRTSREDFKQRVRE